MKVELTCPACLFHFRGNAPDEARRVKCPKCAAGVPIPAPMEEEILDGEIIEDDMPELAAPEPPPPMVVAVPDAPMVLPAPDPEDTGEWELVGPRAFGIYPRSITGGVSYEICDTKTDDVLGDAREHVDGGKATVGFLVGRHTMKGLIVVTDADTDAPILAIERDNLGFLGNKPPKVKLYDHRDELLASFNVGTPAFGGLVLNFDSDCTILDADKKSWAVAEGIKRRAPDYVFLTRKGKKLGRVRGKGDPKGLLAASGSWTGKGGWLKLTIDDDFDASPSDKLIMLGVAIAIESILTTVKETKPGTIRLN